MKYSSRPQRPPGKGGGSSPDMSPPSARTCSVSQKSCTLIMILPSSNMDGPASGSSCSTRSLWRAPAARTRSTWGWPGLCISRIRLTSSDTSTTTSAKRAVLKPITWSHTASSRYPRRASLSSLTEASKTQRNPPATSSGRSLTSRWM